MTAKKPEINKVCYVCSDKFITTYVSKTTCDKKQCKNRRHSDSRQELTFTCEWCSIKFSKKVTSKKTKYRYCSMKCGGLGRRGKKINNVKAVPLENICGTCKKTFKYRKMGDRVKKYCCQPCYWKSITTGGTLIDATCGTCNKSFQYLKSGKRKQKFCCKECASISMSGYEMKTHKCTVCEKDFEKRMQGDKVYKYCSHKCREKTFTGGTMNTFVCQNELCGITFQKKADKHALNKYCSRECSKIGRTTGNTMFDYICQNDECSKTFQRSYNSKKESKYCSVECGIVGRCVGVTMYDFVCQNRSCGKGFTDKKPKRKYCCYECSQKDNKGNAKIQYKDSDIWFHSKWEESFAFRLNDLGIKWTRPGYDDRLPWYDNKGKLHYYTPDFYLPEHDRIIEIKSKYTESRRDNGVETVKRKYIEKYYPDIFWIWSKKSCQNFIANDLNKSHLN